MPSLSTYLTRYKVGDVVDIVANSAEQKGMPHKYYQGRTGLVYNVSKSAVGIIIYKVVGNRYMEKRVNLRVEHIRHSKCRQEFLQRVKTNAALRKEASEKGEKILLKRMPRGPREAATISIASLPETIVPIPYDTKI